MATYGLKGFRMHYEAEIRQGDRVCPKSKGKIPKSPIFRSGALPVSPYPCTQLFRSASACTRKLKFGKVIGFALKPKEKFPKPKIFIQGRYQGPLTNGHICFEGLPHALRS